MRRLVFTLITTFLILLGCKTGSYQRIDNGIIVNLNDSISKSIKLEVFDDNIVHVVVSPKDEIVAKPSLCVVDQNPNVAWSILEEGEYIGVKTDSIIVKINNQTGQVAFYDIQNNLILNEPAEGAKTFEKVTVGNEEKYSVRQVFDSPDDEAFYGLGQHQHGQVNYKGQDVELAQHNLVAVVPFLYSSKNYGILWDNYSITRFGDPRAYQQLDATLNLFDKDGKSGGLTATYTDRRSGKVTIQTESKIDYQNIDVEGNMPDILTNKEKIVWEGSISSDIEGIHKFLLYASEYFKLWVNDELIFDKWRQGWNPWSNKFNIEMKKGEKYNIKLEWKPMGGGYMALQHIDPMDPAEQNQLSMFSEVADNIDYYFIKGNNADEVISGYRSLTGKAPIMPKWAMGLWQSRERYKTQEELLNVVKEYRKRNIPIDNIVLDWFYWEAPRWGSHEFDSTRFPDPDKMIRTLHDELNTRIMISVWPKFNVGTENFDAMKENGFLFERYLDKKLLDWVGYYSTFYDAFNPDARKLFWKQINEQLTPKGIDAWWMDATEPDMHSNFSVEERKLLMTPNALGTGAEYFNAFSLVNTSAVYEGWMQEKPDVRPFILTRSAFAGQQRYSAATWSGDVVTRWSDLKDQIAAGINFCMSGIPYWTTDIGGFSVEQRYERQENAHLAEWREINMRWYQFGTFCPLFRIHGQFPFREIFNISPENHPVYKSMVYYDKLRYRMMPYIYTLAAETYHNDYTIMRGLAMDFAGDKNVFDINDQFMFGPSLMVNPVYEFKADKRNVYLPSTNGWYDVYSGAYYDGGKTIEADAPLTKIPLYAPEGAILVFGPEIQYAMEKKADPITIMLFTGKDGEFMLYEDDGLNNNYKKGEFSIIPISYNDNEKSLVIGKRKGEYPGMLNECSINIIVVDRKSGKGIDNIDEVDHSIKYNGNEQTILIN